MKTNTASSSICFTVFVLFAAMILFNCWAPSSVNAKERKSSSFDIYIDGQRFETINEYRKYVKEKDKRKALAEKRAAELADQKAWTQMDQESLASKQRLDVKGMSAEDVSALLGIEFDESKMKTFDVKKGEVIPSKLIQNSVEGQLSEALDIANSPIKDAQAIKKQDLGKYLQQVAQDNEKAMLLVARQQRLKMFQQQALSGEESGIVQKDEPKLKLSQQGISELEKARQNLIGTVVDDNQAVDAPVVEKSSSEVVLSLLGQEELAKARKNLVADGDNEKSPKSIEIVRLSKEGLSELEKARQNLDLDKKQGDGDLENNTQELENKEVKKENLSIKEKLKLTQEGEALLKQARQNLVKKNKTFEMNEKGQFAEVSRPDLGLSDRGMSELEKARQNLLLNK